MAQQSQNAFHHAAGERPGLAQDLADGLAMQGPSDLCMVCEIDGSVGVAAYFGSFEHGFLRRWMTGQAYAARMLAAWRFP